MKNGGIVIKPKEQGTQSIFDFFHKMIFRNRRNKFTELLLWFLFFLSGLILGIPIIVLFTLT